MKNLLIFLSLLIIPFSLKTEEEKEVYKYLNLFGEAFEKIKNNYVEDVTSKDLIESAIEGMLSSLDPHSTYLNYDELNDGLNDFLEKVFFHQGSKDCYIAFE